MAVGIGGLGKGIITLNLLDKAQLYASYMPFVKNGGLFVRTTKDYHLGDEVFLLVSLLDDNEKKPVTGRVIWVSPNSVHGSRPAGIGIQLSEADVALKGHIENLLAGQLNSNKPTYTL